MLPVGEGALLFQDLLCEVLWEGFEGVDVGCMGPPPASDLSRDGL